MSRVTQFRIKPDSPGGRCPLNFNNVRKTFHPQASQYNNLSTVI